jgi:hypothetical protein
MLNTMRAARWGSVYRSGLVRFENTVALKSEPFVLRRPRLFSGRLEACPEPSRRGRPPGTSPRRFGLTLVVLGLLAFLTYPTGPFPVAAVEQQHFRSPEAGLRALIEAAKADDHDRLLAIFGADAADLVFSGDEVADREALARFVTETKERTKLVKVGDTTVIIHFGKDDESFPIPLVKDDSGWRFDTVAGKEEMLNRRIGRNELHTIAVCHAYVDAQREYASKIRNGAGVREYAQKFHSTPGKEDGLYWEVSANEKQSPMGPLVAMATSEGYAHKEAHAEPLPFHGYFFRILTAQGLHAPEGARSYIVNGHMTGGFALVAYPAQYRSSGVMTFVVNQLGIVFQKDLGDKTAEIAATMTQYDPDHSWHPVEDSL